MLATNRTLPLAALALSLVALAGCGGGSGGGTKPPGDKPPEMPDDDGAGGPIVVPPKKSVPSIAKALEDPANQLVPRQKTLRRDYHDSTSTVVGDFAVTKVAGDGMGGYHVTYLAGGDERIVHFMADAFEAGDCAGDECYFVEIAGERFWLWSHTGAFVDAPRFQYFDLNGGSFPAGNRVYLAYGVRTDTDSLPAGTASYVGWMNSNTWPSDDPDGAQRVDFNGALVLTADFDAETLEGRIDGLQTRSRDADGDPLSWKPMSKMTWFEIKHRTITDAQFEADLIGMDSRPNPVMADTVEGYSGQVLGEFFGPSGTEVGGVLHAESTGHGRVMAGVFGGTSTKPHPTIPEGDRSILSVAVDRDYLVPSTDLTDMASVTAVAGHGARGFRVTYNVDGTQEVVTLGADDYGSQPDAPDIYYSMTGDRGYSLGEQTASFFFPPEFDHFNVEGWAVVDFDQMDMVESIKSGFVAYGTPTEVADLPAGAARYAGRVEGEIWSMDAAARSEEAMAHLLADFNLEANFDESTVGGMIDNFRVQESGADDYDTVGGEVAIQNGMIAQSGFTADLVQAPYFTGDMTGQFFGPGAAEVGGIISGTDEVGREVLQGWFGGTKQP